MVFNSLLFVAFFAAVLALHALPFSWRQKKLHLLLASYLFYSAWNPPFVILLWVSTVVDWFAAQEMIRAKNLRGRFAGFRPGPWSLAGLGLLTFILTNITWVFFRAKTFDKAWTVLRGMAGLNAQATPLLAAVYLLTTALIVGGIVAVHAFMRHRTLEQVVARTHPVAITAARPNAPPPLTTADCMPGTTTVHGPGPRG